MEKCKYCGWEAPSPNHHHTTRACDEIREQALLRVVRAARTHLDTDGDDEGEMLEEALEALPPHLRGE